MSAEDREREAWAARCKHVKAAQAWFDIAAEHKGTGKRPTPAECLILAEWMEAYATADAEAEAAFRALVTDRQSEERTTK